MSPEVTTDGPLFVAWYVRSFDEATEEWTCQQVGAYYRLLAAQVKRGSIPSDPAALARLVGEDREAFAGMWRSLLRSKFEECPDDPGRLVNERMAIEREKAIAKSNASRVNGAKGGRPPKTETQEKPSGLPGGLASGHPGSEQNQDSLSLSSSLSGSGSDAEGRSRKALDTACVTSGFPGWVPPLLLEYLEARAEIAHGGEEFRGPPTSATGWKKLGDALARTGEGESRRALDEVISRPWVRMGAGLDWARDNPETSSKGPRGTAAAESLLRKMNERGIA